MSDTQRQPEIWLMGLGCDEERSAKVRDYLTYAGYRVTCHGMDDFADGRPLGVVLDLSPFSRDGWGILLDIKNNAATRDVPILPVYLSQEGKVGGIFPAVGFFTLPVDPDYLLTKLAVLGLTEDAETWDLQVMVVSKRGEEHLAKALTSLGFDVVNAYTGKEAVALATIGRPFMVFCCVMLPDMSAFELMERFRLFPQVRNVPFFVLVKDAMKEGERAALSRQVEHLVRKKELTREEFATHLRRRR
ncbi:response regulator receiver protein [Geobacter metallireducens RCH3]|uniref:Response receiver n=1 Tax=Geobacter metallireducens (strain ATCC 53774 / DSM 7210 / GS-15) TaxID=269799 RepID=Q39XM0_GEOMG|nr:response regulator [Geobacter metallireducens]ABB31004.1 response receiver [Geobacter metallireducens GS-15]EHP86010.1 response regulator receiver protein [Geobacter metallireducens RCH3]